MIICHTVSEIQCVIDVIIFYFGLFFAILPPPPPLPSPHQPKKWKFEKNEKTFADTISLHMCTKNNDHMMYGSWNMVHDR